MSACYQIVLLGSSENNYKQYLEADIRKKISELGIDVDEHVSFLSAENVASFSKKYLVTAVFFGSEYIAQKDIDAAEILVDKDYLVIPVVADLERYKALTPESLHLINGTELNAQVGSIDAISNMVLEALNLLRSTRKLFISYRRQESRAIAIQLYEHLHSSGFDVFIDTISIRPGEPFQEVLWHKLSDTDVVVLLDTPGFLESRWTREELANTAAMSIGILQIIWPNHTPDPKSSLCDRIYLNSDDITLAAEPNNSILTDMSVKRIVTAVEVLRSRSLAARYESLIGVVGQLSDDLGINLSVQPERYAIIQKGEKRVAVIPTVGVPEAIRYQEISEMVNAIQESSFSHAFLLYDHCMIRDRWRKHLEWLDSHLPIKSVRIVNSESWLQKL